MKLTSWYLLGFLLYMAVVYMYNREGFWKMIFDIGSIFSKVECRNVFERTLLSFAAALVVMSMLVVCYPLFIFHELIIMYRQRFPVKEPLLWIDFSLEVSDVFPIGRVYAFIDLQKTSAMEDIDFSYQCTGMVPYASLMDELQKSLRLIDSTISVKDWKVRINTEDQIPIISFGIKAPKDALQKTKHFIENFCKAHEIEGYLYPIAEKLTT